MRHVEWTFQDQSITRHAERLVRHMKLCIDYLYSIYIFLKKLSIFKRHYAGTFDVSCGMFSNVISLVLGYSENLYLEKLYSENIYSEKVSLIWRSISDR